MSLLIRSEREREKGKKKTCTEREREREHKLLNKTNKKASGEGRRRSAGSFLDWSPKIGCGETRRSYRNFV